MTEATPTAEAPTLHPDDEALLALVPEEHRDRLTARLASAPTDTGPRSPKPDATQGMDRTAPPAVTNRDIAAAAFEAHASEQLRWQD